MAAGIEGSGPVGAPPRHPCKFRAFVVGNNAYQRAPPLAMCVNDARAVGTLLQRKGYVVTILENAGVDSFAEHFYNFACSLSAGCTVVVHFSGHGFQAAGANRLLFVDQAEVDAAEGAIMMEPLYARRVQVGCCLQIVAPTSPCRPHKQTLAALWMKPYP